MIARVGVTRIRPRDVEASRRLWEDEIIPAMRKHEGFRHLYVLGNDRTNQVITISIWDSEEAAAAWARSDDLRRFKIGLKPYREPVPGTFDITLHA